MPVEAMGMSSTRAAQDELAQVMRDHRCLTAPHHGDGARAHDDSAAAQPLEAEEDSLHTSFYQRFLNDRSRSCIAAPLFHGQNISAIIPHLCQKICAQGGISKKLFCCLHFV